LNNNGRLIEEKQGRGKIVEVEGKGVQTEKGKRENTVQGELVTEGDEGMGE